MSLLQKGLVKMRYGRLLSLMPKEVKHAAIAYASACHSLSHLDKVEKEPAALARYVQLAYHRQLRVTLL